jgi:hypothetical protein
LRTKGNIVQEIERLDLLSEEDEENLTWEIIYPRKSLFSPISYALALLVNES